MIWSNLVNRGHMANHDQLESVLSWFKKYYELKSIGGTWHHQANYSVAQVVAQLPNVVQLDFGVQHDMIGMSGELIWFLYSKYSSSMQRNPSHTSLLPYNSANLPSKLVAHGLQGTLLTSLCIFTYLASTLSNCCFRFLVEV
jgi:hypothetical protein